MSFPKVYLNKICLTWNKRFYLNYFDKEGAISNSMNNINIFCPIEQRVMYKKYYVCVNIMNYFISLFILQQFHYIVPSVIYRCVCNKANAST